MELKTKLQATDLMGICHCRVHKIY